MLRSVLERSKREQPSLHFGYAFLIGASLFVNIKSKISVLALLYPLLILLAIVATANHYILDAVAGLAVSCLAHGSNQFLLNFLIVEDYLFYFLHLHKPQVEHQENSRDIWSKQSESYPLDRV